MHHKTPPNKKETIVLKANKDLLQEIKRQLSMGVDSVFEEDRWMLELNVNQLLSFSLVEKQLWIHAVVLNTLRSATMPTMLRLCRRPCFGMALTITVVLVKWEKSSI